MTNILTLIVILCVIKTANGIGWFGLHITKQSTKSSLFYLDLRGGADSQPSTSSEVSSIDASDNCKDGVCALPVKDQSKKSSLDRVLEVENTEGITTLEALGFTKQDAIGALKKSGGSVEAAAELLEAQEEEKELVSKLAKELSDKGGWSIEAAASALKETNKNLTSAASLLEEEEASIISQFEAATADMLENGWDEVVARQALLAQYTIDQRRASGQAQNTSREVLDSIRPTLKKVETHHESKRPPGSQQKKGTGTASDMGDSSGESRNKPKPAKKEDCVFDVTSSNFQSIVMESPVPVLVDVYADWCGPCKQLGPILEEAAINSGGMFRLAKVNSDNERSIAEALNVQGLPTVFSVNSGKLTDRFVGMLPQDQLQQYLVRCVTGFGERVQAQDISEDELEDFTRKIASLAGLSSISFKKREKLLFLVDEACSMDGAVEKDSHDLSAGMKVSLLYIGNAAKDIRNKRVTSISDSSKAFVDKVAPNPAARRILEVAGFRPEVKNINGTECTVLTLLHANPAILTMVSQRVVDTITSKKFQNLKKSAVKLGENPSFRAPKASDNTLHGEGANRHQESATVNTETGVPLSFLGLNTKVKQQFPDNFTVKDALTELLASKEARREGEVEQWSRLEKRYPPPREVITPESSILTSSMGEWRGRGGLVLGLVQSDVESAMGDAGTDTISKALRKKKKRLARTKKRGSVSLRDYDEKDRKVQESFGGAETVTLLGEESDSDADVDF